MFNIARTAMLFPDSGKRFRALSVLRRVVDG